MIKPVYVFIDGRELEGWTSLTLNRSKESLTGSLTLELFFNYIPMKPIEVTATRSKNISVYIDGYLVFHGKIDKRKAKGKKGGKGKKAKGNTQTTVENDVKISSSISSDSYQVTLTARGQTKFLVDSSHQHDTTNIMKTSTRKVLQELVAPWNIELEWMATDIPLEKVVLRDGSSVYEEVHRIASENCYFVYETKDGKLRVTDDTSKQTGDMLILGHNIMSFSSEQSEEKAKSKIKVKGQRNSKEIWGKAAIKETIVEIEDSWVGSTIPITIQHYGDATEDALQRRAKFEADKRSSMSKKVSLKLFHVMQEHEGPWDIGLVHYIEIPPEGIFDIMECVELTYHITPESVTTDATFAPIPSMSLAGGANPGGFLSGLPTEFSDLVRVGTSRRVAAGVTIGGGGYPAAWTGADLTIVDAINEVIQPATSLEQLAQSVASPAHKLPVNFWGKK